MSPTLDPGDFNGCQLHPLLQPHTHTATWLEQLATACTDTTWQRHCRQQCGIVDDDGGGLVLSVGNSQPGAGPWPQQ